MFVHSVFIEACDSHLSMATLNDKPSTVGICRGFETYLRLSN